MCKLCLGKQHITEICEKCIIPDYMTELYLSGENITRIPKLPSSLKILSIKNMKKLVFPIFPDLEVLRVMYCEDIFFPVFPDCLKKLFYIGNRNSEICFPNNIEVLYIKDLPKII